MSDLVRNGAGRNHGMPALLGWDPWNLVRDLMSWTPVGFTAYRGFSSPVRIVENDESVIVTLDVPGVDPQDLDLTLQHDRLTIEGRRDQSTFAHAFRVPETIDPDHIEAELKNGVLTVRAAKRPEAKPRRIALVTKEGTDATRRLDTGDRSDSE